MTQKELALKPFLEILKTYCDKLKKSELIDLLCQTAQEIPAEERAVFLKKLTVAPAEKSGGNMAELKTNDIIARAETLAQDIIALHESVDDGSYYEGRWEDGEYYDDEEFFGISEEQKKRFEQLIAETNSLFLVGELDVAWQVYEKLTDLILYGEDLLYTVNFDEVKINWRETLARYCRCVYEVSSDAERTKRMRQALAVDQRNFSDSSEGIFPSLQDIFDAKAGELAGWNDFLQQLRNNLSNAVSSRGILLYLEAVQWLSGLSGLAEAARKKQAPVGYLFWLDQLQKNEAWSELAQAAQESLQAMPLDDLRAQAAAQLCIAGAHIGDSDLIMQGQREQFFSSPNDRHLSALLQEALGQKKIETELRRVLDFFAAQPLKNRSVAKKMLELKTLLLLGKLDEVYNKIGTKKAIGWSGEEQPSGAVYTALLVVLSKGNPAAATIHALFSRYTCGKHNSEVFLCEEMKKSLLKVSFTAFQESKWLLFVEEITTERIKHIVSNKYRKGYARAAEALGGYVECLTLQGQQDKATAFLRSQRDEKFKRYPAFRQEVDTVIKHSPLLSVHL